MADTSDTGHGVAVSEATLEGIRTDATYSEMRGWAIAAKDPHTHAEAAPGRKLVADAPATSMTSPSAPPPSIARPGCDDDVDDR